MGFNALMSQLTRAVLHHPTSSHLCLVNCSFMPVHIPVVLTTVALRDTGTHCQTSASAERDTPHVQHMLISEVHSCLR